MKPSFFDRQGPLDFAAGERTISAWKTKQVKINDCHYIEVLEGSDSHEKNLGKTFEVIAFHFGGAKIAFNENRPVDLAELADESLTTSPRII